MSKILIKQVSQVLKNELPNIKVTLTNDNMSKLNVTFYYKRTLPDDTYPYFFYKVDNSEILINGTVDLTDFPNRPPKFNLVGEVAHCHVHQGSQGYVLCFSLDESYQWFFGQKHMQSSKFNPSVSLAYYLVAVYKFLAEDDREHEVGDDRRKRAIDYWKAHEPVERPDTLLSYYEALQIMTDLTGNPANNQVEIDSTKIAKSYDLDKVPESILNLTDFVDKEPLLLKEEPILFPINYLKVGERHVYKVVSLDLMKESTFNSGIRKTSLSQDFNSAFPLTIHSKFYDKVKPQKILDALVNLAFKNVKTNQVIKLNDKVIKSDHYLYIISELFNELAIDVFAETMFPCEEVLKGFVHLHHLLLVLDKQEKLVGRSEQILDFFEQNDNNRDKKMCGNLGILMTQYLVSKKKRNISYLVDEMLARNVMWSLKKPGECKSCIGFNEISKKFYITNMDKWINITWQNSYIGMQRFAFQQLYNVKFSSETFETMDSRFGQVSQSEIELFQQNVKELCKWKDLKGHEGYKTFLAFFGLSDDTLSDRLKAAMGRSTFAGYHSFLLQKEWKASIKSITGAKIIN